MALKHIFYFDLKNINYVTNCVERCLNDSHRGKPKYLGGDLYQCYIVYHKSQMDWFGFKPRPLR